MTPGETDLAALLRGLRPLLRPAPHVFCAVPPGRAAELLPDAAMLFREDEGVTAILSAEAAHRHGLPESPWWAWVTLSVHSSLAAVGLMAAVSARLAAAGVSVNPVAGFHHDHLFVPWEARELAVAELAALSARAGQA